MRRRSAETDDNRSGMAYYTYDGFLALSSPAPTNNLFGTTAGGETLTGGTGPDGLYAQGAGDLLIGGSGGGDTFYVQASGARIQASSGPAANTLVTFQNTSLADYANIQNLSVGGGHTYAVGDGGNNIIVATGDHQQLYGGGGQDVLVGDGQSDTFIVAKGVGDDAIYGFNTATDVVRLSAGYASFAQVQAHMTQVGADVDIDLGGGSGVVLRGVDASHLTAANFQLQLDASKLGQLTFDDEFNSLNLWNGSSGTWATTFWYQDPNGNGGTLASNGEQEWYVNANYAPTAAVQPWTVSGGQLTLTAAPASTAIQAQIDGYRYTSGELNTFHSFAQTYGYFEMRAELPQTAGGWPAFWLMPTDGSWPPELDVMETLTSDPHADYTTAHSGATGSHTMSQGLAFVPDTTDGNHTYGVLWTPQTLTWYVDGVEVYETATPADMNKPMYMIANLALGGWGGDVDASQLPAQMKVDYIRSYALADGSSTVALDTAHTGGGTAASNPGTPVVTPPNTTDSGGGGSGGATTPTGPVVLTATSVGAVLTGGAFNDTLYTSQANDTLTGGAGADHFVFNQEPWAPVHIADFQVGTDVLDLSPLFRAAGYAGGDPVADHYIAFESDGNGGTLVRYDHDGTGSNPVWPNTIIDLEHVSPTGLTWAALQGAPATSSPGGGSGGGSSGGGAAGASAVGQALQAAVGGGSVEGGAGPDTLTGDAVGANHLRGGDGNDQVLGGFGYDDVNGNKGDDTITGRSQTGDWLLGGQGQDSISAVQSTGHNIINGNLGSDTLHGGTGGDSLRGGQGDDLIVGGSGADWISGDKGFDTLTGGGGADTFHSGPAGGTGTITDFNVAEGDHIQLDHGSQYTVAQSGPDVVVTLDGGAELVLQNVQRASLDGHDWIVVA